MHVVSKTSIFPCMLVLICIVVNVTSALQCTNCLDPRSCRSSPGAVECAEDNVSLHHRLLGNQNPSLASSGGEGNGDGFKCFDLKMTYISPLTGSSVLVEEKGCTYATTDFCTGWDSTAQVDRCSTCDSGDECNK